MIPSRCCRTLLASMILLPTARTLYAQPADAPDARPCASDARYRAFDFWIGSWEVRNAEGRLLGTNDITPAEDGCVLIERWRGESGSTGMSINYFDPGARLWRQHWVAASGYVVELAGKSVDNAMVLEGSLIQRDGSSRPMRGTWTPLDDGRIRQHFEVADSTRAWTTWFDGFYEKVDGG